MTKCICLLLSIALLAFGDAWYVATDGDNANPGTLASPYASAKHALTNAGAGDTVYVRGGTYRLLDLDGAVKFTNGGATGNPVVLCAYADEKPVLLGSKQLTGWEAFQGSIYRCTAPADHDVKGLWQDTRKVDHPLYMDNGNRSHPPLDMIDGPGKWTLQAGWVYCWAWDNADPDSHTMEASQVPGIWVSKSNVLIDGLTVHFTQPNTEGGGGIHIGASQVHVRNCEVGHNANGGANAYAVYFSFAANCTLSQSTVFDSHYWGGDGADQNSHVVSLIASGDDGPIIIEHNELYNDGGMAVGSKGANVNVWVRNNYIHGTAAGVKPSSIRSSGPGAGWTDRGHYRVHGNIFKDNGYSVKLGGTSNDNHIYNNVMVNNGKGVAIVDNAQAVLGTQVVNNIFVGSDYAVYLRDKFYGDNNHYNEEAFQYFKDRGLESHHNLFWQNTVDYVNPVNDWGTPVTVDKTFEEILTYKDLGWEANSVGADPNLDADYAPLAGSPVIDAGTDMGLGYWGNAPDIGAKEYAAGNIRFGARHRAVSLFDILQKGNNLTIMAPQAMDVDLRIMDVFGRTVWQSGKLKITQGTHQLPFRAGRLAQNRYLLRANSGTRNINTWLDLR